LREPGHIDHKAQQALAALLDELSNILEGATIPAAEVTHLAESTAHLAEALHQQDRGLLGNARERFDRALWKAEARVPTVVGLARRLLEALGNIGI
jgi:hypothetical protein